MPIKLALIKVKEYPKIKLFEPTCTPPTTTVHTEQNYNRTCLISKSLYEKINRNSILLFKVACYFWGGFPELNIFFSFWFRTYKCGLVWFVHREDQIKPFSNLTAFIQGLLLFGRIEPIIFHKLDQPLLPSWLPLSLLTARSSPCRAGINQRGFQPVLLCLFSCVAFLPFQKCYGGKVECFPLLWLIFFPLALGSYMTWCVYIYYIISSYYVILLYNYII